MPRRPGGSRTRAYFIPAESKYALESLIGAYPLSANRHPLRRDMSLRARRHVDASPPRNPCTVDLRSLDAQTCIHLASSMRHDVAAEPRGHGTKMDASDRQVAAAYITPEIVRQTILDMVDIRSPTGSEAAMA